jgi:DNA-binding transcriptional regulator YhcF (GntR family)
MGLPDLGDNLPAVREVVAATAVNPNTVLVRALVLLRRDAYRPDRRFDSVARYIVPRRIA